MRFLVHADLFFIKTPDIYPGQLAFLLTLQTN